METDMFDDTFSGSAQCSVDRAQPRTRCLGQPGPGALCRRAVGGGSSSVDVQTCTSVGLRPI